MLSEYDTKYLAARARDARDAEAEALEARIFEHCRWIMLGVISNQANGFRRCPRAACRRARRCSGSLLVCRKMRRARLSVAREREMIDELYWQTQQERLRLSGGEGDLWWRAFR